MHRLLVVVCVLLACNVSGASGLRDPLDAALDRITKLEARLSDREAGEILLFVNRETCPEGFYPMENAEGRLVVIGSSKTRGRTSVHTLEDQRILTMPCAQTIGVSEEGSQTVCHSDQSGTPVIVDLEHLLPHIMVMACSRQNAPQPVIP